MRAITRLTVGAAILTGIVVSLIVVLARTDDTAVAGQSGAGYGTPTVTPTPAAIVTTPICPAGTPTPPGTGCLPCPGFGAQIQGEISIQSTCPPTASPTPTPTATGGPACPGAPSPPGGTCPPCPTFNVQANDVGPYSTCAPSPTPTPTSTPTPGPCVTDPTSPVPTDFCSGTPTFTPTPTPFVSPTPCPQVSPTNCDVVFPPLGDADCSYQVNLDDVTEVLRDSAEVEDAQCQVPGNVKCDDGLDPMDALLILEHVALTDPQLPAWCPSFV